MLERIKSYIDRAIVRKEPLLNGSLEKKIKKYNGAILCLHRVDVFDPNRLWINECLKVSPTYLENLIVAYLKQGVDIISLDDVVQRLGNKSNKPFVSFTFDDGYKDNFVNAYPIFKKYNLPFCINIASSFPERKAILFWYILEDILMNNDYVILNDGTRFECKTKESKEIAFKKIRSLIFEIPVSEYDKGIKDLLYNYEVDLYEPVKKYAMDWSEIVELKESGLCTFGNHTHSHISMLDTNESDIINDILLCNELFKRNIGDDMHYFCFPYGRYDERTQKVIEMNFSFKGLLTLRRKYIDQNSKRSELHRFLIEEKK